MLSPVYPCNEDAPQSVQIVGVSAFQAEVHITRIGWITRQGI